MKSHVSLFLGIFIWIFLNGCTSPSSVPDRGRSIQVGDASYYGIRWHGHRTANGEQMDVHALTAAHKTLPFHTRVRVTMLSTGKSVIVRINDRGPFVKGRIIDLSNEAAKRIGLIRAGIAKVRVEVLP